MSRWSVTNLAQLTEQQIFDMCAYHMLAHGGAPRDLLVKPESRKFIERRNWATLVRFERAPKHAVMLITDIERVHDEIDPGEWFAHLVTVAQLYSLEPPQ